MRNSPILTRLLPQARIFMSLTHCMTALATCLYSERNAEGAVSDIEKMMCALHGVIGIAGLAQEFNILPWNGVRLINSVLVREFTMFRSAQMLTDYCTGAAQPQYFYAIVCNALYYIVHRRYYDAQDMEYRVLATVRESLARAMNRWQGQLAEDNARMIDNIREIILPENDQQLLNNLMDNGLREIIERQNRESTNRVEEVLERLTNGLQR